MALPSTLYFSEQSHLLIQYEILLDYSNHPYFISSFLITLRLSNIVRLNANGKKSAWPPSPFKPTGACSKSNGTSRKRFEHACWFRGCSGGTLLAYGWIQRSKTGIRRDRWHTMRKWQLLFRNCKWPRTISVSLFSLTDLFGNKIYHPWASLVGSVLRYIDTYLPLCTVL